MIIKHLIFSLLNSKIFILKTLFVFDRFWVSSGHFSRMWFCFIAIIFCRDIIEKLISFVTKFSISYSSPVFVNSVTVWIFVSLFFKIYFLKFDRQFIKMGSFVENKLLFQLSNWHFIHTETVLKILKSEQIKFFFKVFWAYF